MSEIKDIRKRLMDNQQYEASLRPGFPKNMLVELTNACNHRCIFCANRKMTRPVGHIDDALMLRVLREAFDLGTREVGFYATGEPFASPNLARYVGEAKRLGYTYIYVTTNGALATPWRAREVIDAGLDSIKFSINAGTRESYERIHGYDDFQRVLQNLAFVSEYRKTLDRPFKVYVSCILTRYTAGEQTLLRSLVEPLVDDIVFLHVMNQGGFMFEVNEYLTVDGAAPTRTPPCPMLFNRAHVTHEGYLDACCVDYQNYLVVADLNTSSLRDAWHSESFVELRRKHLAGAVERTLCHNCLFNTDMPVEPWMPRYAAAYQPDKARIAAEMHDRLRGLPADEEQKKTCAPSGEADVRCYNRSE